MRRVLVADRHAAVAAALSVALVRARLQPVGPALSLREALTMAEALRPHAVVLDLGLRDARGLHGLREFRAAHPDLVLVACLSAPDRDLQAAAEEHADSVLVKGAAGVLIDLLTDDTLLGPRSHA